MLRRAIALITLLCLVVLGLGAVFWLPPWAVELVRTEVVPRIEERIGRRVEVGEVKIGWGWLDLWDIHVDGAGAPSPLHVPHATVGFQLWPLLTGQVALTTVTLEHPRVSIVRSQSGDDNISSIVARLRGREHGGGEAEAGGRHRRTGPTTLDLHGGTISVEDDNLGELEVASLEAHLVRDGRGTVTLGDVDLRLSDLAVDAARDRDTARIGATATAGGGPSVHARSIIATLDVKAGKLDGLPSISVDGGDLRIWKGFAVSGITGAITPDLLPGRANLDFRGGYGGVDKVLWSAKGWATPTERRGELELVAARFDLGQLAPILSGTPVIDPADAQVDAHLQLTYHPGTDDASPNHLHDALDFDGRIHLAGLNVYHPKLGPTPLRHLGFDASANGTLEPRARALHLSSAVVDYRGVRATVSLEASKLGKRPALKGSLDIPSVPCQSALAAIPQELVPTLQGFKLAGNFKSEVHLDIDPDDLEHMDLGSNIGIDGCSVTQAPSAVDADRLRRTFQHAVEVEPGSWLTFPVGPERPDWVPFASISQHLVNSIMTTEDSNFLQHRGFIGREFKSALKTNLEHGAFRLGASSISMQMVKNVLLSREKTLSRKLQEMFLTWYIEHHLSKERILEIYFNAIEFGPGIYGIGRAAQHYFGKSAKDLVPREAAFFSSILPNPKRRYVHYCNGPELDQKWETYLNRILRRMHERGRLTDGEYDEAINAHLKFDLAEAQPAEQCLEMVRRLTASQEAGANIAGAHIPIPLGPMTPVLPPVGDFEDPSEP